MEEVQAIRAFNRFYTSIIGVLDEGILHSDYSLAEARIIHETGTHGGRTAVQLVHDLSMDAGQLSRLVKRMIAKGLLLATPSKSDKRVTDLTLSQSGAESFNHLNALSDAASEALIAPLPAGARQQLVHNMLSIRAILGAQEQANTIKMRSHRVGEIGWFIHRQAVLYNLEFGWNSEFEALVAKIYADFEAAPYAPNKALWVAEVAQQVAGSICVVPAPDNVDTAQLRLLYVEPWARGLGLGRQLVDEVVLFSRDKGYKSIILWTQDCLESARRIYQAVGFELEKEALHHSFGHDLNGQYWRLEL